MQIDRRMALKFGAALPLAATGGGAFGAGNALAQQPMRGPQVAPLTTFRLGDFEVSTIVDATRPVEPIHPIFGADQSEADFAALMSANNLPASTALFYFTPTLVNTGSELVLFDTGNGGETGQLLATLEAAGIGADAVDIVVLTHMHPDHIGGLMTNGAPSFPNARYVTGRAEYDFWAAAPRSGPTERVAGMVADLVTPLAEKMTFVEDGQDVVTGITALATHGHTPGHMSFVLNSSGQSLIVWGDVANHFVSAIQRPDWQVRFDMDKAMAASTRRRVFDMVAAEKMPIIGYHMPAPALGYLESHGSGYRWAPASYQLLLP
ncbi:MAG: MBL fold metallo-hydrolase [Hyphomicrobiaceae bacterium]|nr:MBL fold metallo-hydrolase [Hyphomicrobiaceae bacterium]